MGRLMNTVLDLLILSLAAALLAAPFLLTLAAPLLAFT